MTENFNIQVPMRTRRWSAFFSTFNFVMTTVSYTFFSQIQVNTPDLPYDEESNRKVAQDL